MAKRFRADTADKAPIRFAGTVLPEDWQPYVLKFDVLLLLPIPKQWMTPDVQTRFRQVAATQLATVGKTIAHQG